MWDSLFSGNVVILLPLGLLFGLPAVLIFGLLFGLRSEELQTKTVPNQGIRESAKNAVILVLLVVLLFVLFYGLPLGLPLGLGEGLLVGLLVGLLGLLFGVLLGVLFGGFAFIKHYVLRFILYRNGHIPWNYARFLDYAAERIFLRKVGGGYIFVHRLLMDYFTSLEPEQEGG